MPVTFDATELALGTHQTGNAPTLPHVAVTPAFHTTGDILRHTEGRLDRVRRGQGATQQLRYAQTDYRERFLHPFPETRCGIRVQPLQPAGCGLQPLESPVVVRFMVGRVELPRELLPVLLRQVLLDIPLLVEHFIRKFSRLNDKEIQGLSPDVAPLLMAHDFPGNIRELENVIEYATVVCRNSLIGIEHLPDYLRGTDASPDERSSSEKPSSLEDVERTYICEAMKRNQWNRTRTAAEMGIHPTTLWRKMKRLNIAIPSSPSAPGT